MAWDAAQTRALSNDSVAENRLFRPALRASIRQLGIAPIPGAYATQHMIGLALARERIARKLSDVLPGGEKPLPAAVWQFMRPMLLPNLAQLNRNAFVLDQALERRGTRDSRGVWERDPGRRPPLFALIRLFSTSGRRQYGRVIKVSSNGRARTCAPKPALRRLKTRAAQISV